MAVVVRERVDIENTTGSRKHLVVAIYYQPTRTQQIITKNNQQTRNGNEEAQVPKWLWQSTSKLLGDDLTFHIINEDSGDADVDGKYSPQTDGHYFDTQSEEFKLNSESTARAWCQWITRFSKGRNRNGSRCDNADQLTYGTIKCSAVNAAKIVDVIIHQVLDTINREEDADEKDKLDDESSWAEGDDATTKTTKLIELINIAIDAWSYSKNRNGEAVQHVEKWLGILQGKH